MTRFQACLVAACCLGAVPVLCTRGFALPDPVEEWSIELGGELAGSPTPYPSASPDSVIVATGGRLVHVDGAGKVIARHEFGPEAGRGGEIMPAPAELDGDPDEELVLTHKAGIVFGFDLASGTILWQVHLGDPLTQYEFAAVGDVDGDGLDEVVATTLFGWTSCIDSHGELLWRTRVETVKESISAELSTPAIGDINNDGHAEIVFGTATHHLIALDRHGRLLWDSLLPPHQMNRTRVLIADVDQNGTAEVFSMSSMLSPDKGVVCVNGEDGSLRWTGLTVGKAYLGLKPIRFADGSRGIVACDKGGNIHAHRSDGSLAWHTRVSGRGIYWPPAVADVDGDGRTEVVAAIRAASLDGRGANWYVLDADTGKQLGGFPHASGLPAPAICDVDGDGVLEILIMSTGGRLSAFSFGGTASEDAVQVPAWYAPRYPTQIQSDKQVRTAEAARAADLELLDTQPLRLRLGSNSLRVNLPQETRSRKAVELACVGPDGVRSVRCVFPDVGARQVDLNLTVTQAGEHRLHLRLLDLETNRTVGRQQRQIVVRDLTEELARAQSKVSAALAANHARLIEQESEAATFLAQLRGEVDTRFALLSARISAISTMGLAEQQSVADEADAHMARLRQAESLMELTLAEAKEDRDPSFVMWPDPDPWDNADPRDELPGSGGPLTIDTWAFGDERESLCVNLANLTSRPLRLRVEPGSIDVADDRSDVRLPSVADVVRFHTTVPLPSVHREVVPDMLPRLAEARIVDVAPGQVQQLWLNLSTHELPSGDYVLRWKVRTVDAATNTLPLTVRLSVSSARCPEKSHFLAGYWGAAADHTMADMNEHLVTIWYGLPLPSARADAQGQLVGTLDWTRHDALLKQIKQPELLFYGGLPTPTFPEGVEVTEALRLRAQRAYAASLVAHHAEMGFGYEDFMFYPEDEPGLKGEITSFMKNARRNKLIDPRFQNYANPWGAFTREMLHEMAEVTDVWQPGMEVLEFWGQEAIDIMRRGDKRVTMYTPPGSPRMLRPLGFFRSQPWLALHWGIEGGGWWVHRQDDLFATGPLGEPDYGGVHIEGRHVISSRRWEAMRDGIEDFNIVTDLRELAEQRGDEAALSAIEDAIDYVAGKVITGATRESAEYDFPYVEFMKFRETIRDHYERLLGE